MELVSAVEEMIEAVPSETEGSVKPELLQSVLEIATDVCRSAAEAAGQLDDLRRRVRETAEAKDLTIGSAATHPFARWEDQRIVERERYREIVDALGFVVRQELLFGLHVHVGIDDADKAIHVANGMRVHLPILLALSTNSPFWRGQATSWASSRTPLFRLLPRVGIPPRFDGLDEYCERIEFMVRAGAIPDYTYLWWDVRPHPNLGTVEVRSCDAQTRLEHTIAITSLIQAMAKELCEHFEAGQDLGAFPAELLEENKWLAARYGMHGRADRPALPRPDAGRGTGPPAGRPAAPACTRAGLGVPSWRASSISPSAARARTANSPNGAQIGTWRAGARDRRGDRGTGARLAVVPDHLLPLWAFLGGAWRE